MTQYEVTAVIFGNGKLVVKKELFKIGKNDKGIEGKRGYRV